MKAPLIALTVDDDEDINNAIKLFLSNLGLKTITCQTPQEFIQALTKKKPDICVIDLMFGDHAYGFDLIKTAREKLDKNIPILIMSGNNDAASIAHAMELGANDFLMKPIDKDLLVTKVTKHLASQESAALKSYALNPKKGGEPARFNVEAEVLEIDEFGITLKSPHVVSKGTVFFISGDLIAEMTDTPAPVLLTVSNTWLIPNQTNFGMYAEFDYTSTQLMANIRKWLALRFKNL